MNINQKKVKFLILGAISLLLLLIVLTTLQIILIHKKEQQIKTQQQEIYELEQKINFYKNQNSSETGEEIIISGE